MPPKKTGSTAELLGDMPPPSRSAPPPPSNDSCADAERVLQQIEKRLQSDINPETRETFEKHARALRTQISKTKASEQSQRLRHEAQVIIADSRYKLERSLPAPNQYQQDTRKNLMGAVQAILAIANAAKRSLPPPPPPEQLPPGQQQP